MLPVCVLYRRDPKSNSTLQSTKSMDGLFHDSAGFALLTQIALQ
jgi:hypothetical protein